MHNTGKKPFLWNVPTELINHFASIKNPAYTTMQIDEFIKLFDRVDNLTSKEIVTLLKGTENFYSKTDLGHFKKIRDETKTDSELLEIFNEMSGVLTKAESNCNAQSKDSLAFQALLDAIAFSKNCVINRLDALNERKDRIYALYLNVDNPLKSILQRRSNQLHPS